MEEQTKRLEARFKKFLLVGDEDPEEYEDQLVLGECWTWKEPEHVEYWSIVLTPTSGHLSFTTKYKNTPITLSVSLHETIIEVSTGIYDETLVSCTTHFPDQEEPYVFTYVVPAEGFTFSIGAICRSLENTDFEELKKDICDHIDKKRWVGKDDGALKPKVLASRLREVLKGFDLLKIKNKARTSNLKPLSITKEYTGAGASNGSLVVETSNTQRSKTKMKTTPKEGRGTPSKIVLPGPKTKGKAVAEAKKKVQEDDSMASVITTLPKDAMGVKEVIDYDKSKKVYKEYWSSCTDSYIFGISKKFEIHVDQLQSSPKTHNVCCLEERGVTAILNFFLEMPDPDQKMTLCAMPQNLSETPTKFEDIKAGKFWMINGQHSVAATKRMKTLDGAEEKYKRFKQWDCFIVWNSDV